MSSTTTPTESGDAHVARACATLLNGSAAPLAQPDGDSNVDLLKAYAYVKRAKLMMVDDEASNLMAIQKHLAGAGYTNVAKTTDANDALAMIDREQPDLVLLDINMPGISGLELLRQIRADIRWQCLPVIILTACRDSNTHRQALDAGCNDFLTKPIDPCELVLRVRNILVARMFYARLAQHAHQLEANALQQAEAIAAARHASEVQYHAGKAEIATEVLHNVGNALNSVNVGVNLVSHTLRNSKILSLQRAMELLRAHAGSLPQFLSKDERGQVLPSYLCDVTDSLLNERNKMASELELLTRHLEHINAVVAAQQKHAKLCHVIDEVSLPELLADVDSLLGGLVSTHGIGIARDYENIPSIWTNRQRLLQVLLNVLKNAVDSIKQIHKAGTGQLTIHLGHRDHEKAVIEVKDNGIGIPPENLSKLFSHGFTTKRDGHGFGLHSCANIIRELGGTIEALSDGAGKGATFRLELPFERKVN